MALVNPYCAVEDVRAALGDSAAKLDQALIERAVNAASRAVDEWCGRKFWLAPSATARTYRPEDAGLLLVDDIGSAAGLQVRTDPGLDGSWSALWTLDADFLLGPENADADGGAFAWWRIEALSGLLSVARTRRPTLQVTARWGWSAVPVQVEQATILRATAIFKRKDAAFGIAEFAEFGPVRIGRSDPDVIDLLSPFRRVVVA